MARTYFFIALQLTAAHFSSHALPADSDYNHLWDDWEMEYFGTLGNDANDDVDGDGQNHFTEMLAGTNPNDGNSYFEQIIQIDSGIPYLYFGPIHSGRVYTLNRSPDLDPASWNAFSVGTLSDYGAFASVPDSDPPSNPSFYKVTITSGYTGNVYYVAADGDDSRDGLAADRAWKTIAHVNEQTFSPGDAILFRRGDTWRETLTVPSSGTDEAPISFGAYGSESTDLPQLLGSEQATDWVTVAGYTNVWKSNTSVPNPFDLYQSEVWFIEKGGTVSWGTHNGDNASILSTLDQEHEVAWADNHIYLYCEENPNTRYLSVEVPVRDNIILLNDQEHLSIDSLRLRYALSRGIYERYSPSIPLSGLEVTNCEIAYFGIKNGANMYGMSLRRSDMYLAYNEIHDCGRRSISIHTYDTTPVVTMENVVIEHNYFHHGYHTTGVDSINTGTHTIQNITIRYNLFEGDPEVDLSENPTSNHIFISNQGSGGYVGDFRIYGNVFTHAQGSAISMQSVANVEVANNTFYGFNPTLQKFHSMVGMGGSSADNITIRNNIFYHNGDEDFFDNIQCVYLQSSSDNAALFNVSIDNNLYYSEDPDAHLTRFYRPSSFHDEYTMAQWADYQAGQGQDLNSPEPADPLFIAPDYGDFRVLGNSPAIDKGTHLDWVTFDRAGNRYDAATPALGAYEYDGSPEATFYSLSIESINGTVSKDPDYEAYLEGRNVTLTANTTYDFVFSGWTGDITSSENPVTIAMDSDKSITANFEPAPEDQESPTAPSNLGSAAITDSSLVLTWIASTDNIAVVAYRVYRDGELLAEVDSTSYTDDDLEPAVSYAYTIVAVDYSGNLSTISESYAVTTDAPYPGVTYYVSNDGDDNADGTSPETAWETIEKVNSFSFSPGDDILFHRGHTWRESLNVNASGTPYSYITFGAYGAGSANPQLLGSTAATDWTQVDGYVNVWRSSSAVRNPFDYYQTAVFFVSSDSEVMWSASVGYGYDDDLSTLDELDEEYEVAWVGESRYNGPGNIYIYCPENPAARYSAVEVPVRTSIINLLNQENIAIDGITLRYGETTGVREIYSPSINLSGLSITNCDIAYFGVKNGSNMYGLSVRHSDMVIAHNSIHDCGRRAISLHAYATDPAVTVENVLIEHNHFYHGYHTTGVDSINSGAHTIRDVTIRYNFFEGDPTVVLDNWYTTDVVEGEPNSNQIFIAQQGNGGYVGDFKIYGNVFAWAHASSVKLEGVDNIHVYNNAFYGFNPTLSNIQGFVYNSHGSSSDLSNVFIKNNIFYNDNPSTDLPARSCVKIDYDMIPAIECDHNLYYTPDSGAWLMRMHDGTHFRTSDWLEYQALTGFDTNSPTPSDPLFVDPANGDFRLATGSPAIAAGTPLPLVSTDKDGQSYSPTSPSLGAFEYQH